MSGVWHRWSTLLSTTEDGASLAVVRILVGVSVVVALLEVLLPGAVPVIWVDAEHGGYRDLGRGTPLVRLLGGPDLGVVSGLCWATVLASALLAAGVASRLTAFVALQGYLSVAWLNNHTAGSYDFVVTNALWLLVLAQSDATGSVAARWKTGRWWPAQQVPVWPRWLMVFQLVLMYASSGLQKISAHWVPGGEMSALYYIMQQPSWQRFDLSFAADVYPLTQAATLGSWLFEVGSPLLLLAYWFRYTRQRPGRIRHASNRADARSVFILAGLFMHAGIHALMDVGPFSYLVVALYPAAFSARETRSQHKALRAVVAVWLVLILIGLTWT